MQRHVVRGYRRQGSDAPNSSRGLPLEYQSPSLYQPAMP